MTIWAHESSVHIVTFNHESNIRDCGDWYFKSSVQELVSQGWVVVGEL